MPIVNLVATVVLATPAVPATTEPYTFMLLGSALLALGLIARHKGMPR
jgi:hypothetical protein